MASAAWISIIGFVLYGLARIAPRSPKILLMSLALSPLLISLGILAAPILRRYRWRRHHPGMIDAEPNAALRICCVGVPDELDALGGLHDVPFEPRVFRASLTIPPTGLAVAIVPVLAALLIGATLLLFSTRVPPLPGVWVTLLVAYGAFAWFRPIYYRVVPGRLDVMRFPVFRSTPPQVQHHDLKANKLLIDLRRHLLFIDGPAGSTELSFALILGRQQFAHAVLLGALSTSPPGPVTDTELVG